MDDILKATELYNNDQNEQAERIAINFLEKYPDSREAIDIIAAVFLKTNKSLLLETGGKRHLNFIRKTAAYLNDLKMWPHALDFYKKALSIEPRDFAGYNNMGLVYEQLQDDENAKICYEKSIKIQYNFYALYNLGIIYRKKKDTQNAIKYVTKALKLNPEDKQTLYSLGMLYFMDSDFETGYKYFLQRKTDGAEFLKNFWDGTAHHDKTLLVFCDSGLGDAIMYSRYFPLLKDKFKEVKVLCSQRLRPVFENSFEGIKFINAFSDDDYDYSVLAMNLPYYLNLDFNHIPTPEGYLKPHIIKVQEYKEKYFNTDKMKVGLFWIGGDKDGRVAKNRFIALTDLKKIIDLKNIQFYSLQVDDPYNDIQFFPNIIDLGKDFEDFSDTAAAIENLDLVITIDSSVLHLAGAMGKKTYLMLPKSTEWRWFKDEKHTLWYNSVELFVQDELYEWDSVAQEIYKKLCKTKKKTSVT